ncbi:MAG: C45 family autoproteolytic acyltransferase/hydrolase [Solirubrobacteraceae bacterium]
MTAELRDRQLDGVVWTTLSGERRAVFETLGEYARAEIAHVLESLPELAELRVRCAAEPALRAHLDSVADASRRDCPDAWSEVEALAAGAGVPSDDLVLLNLRGDLGPPAGRALAVDGCTSVGWSDGRHAFLGHNEDGAPQLLGRCRLLTLQIDGEPSVTAWWYPGFIPSNTFAINSAGIVCAINNINVTRPAAAPGRHFVAREVHGGTDLDQTVRLLSRSPSAGGFTYVLGQAGRADVHVLETAAGDSSGRRYPDRGRALAAHANHLVLLDPGLDAPEDESLARAEIYDRVEAPVTPDGEWLLRLLCSDQPSGVYRHGADGDRLLTLATFVVDLARATVTVVARGAAPLELTIGEFTADQTALATQTR